jgi:3-dehydroquinate synthase class II
MAQVEPPPTENYDYVSLPADKTYYRIEIAENGDLVLVVVHDGAGVHPLQPKGDT